MDGRRIASRASQTLLVGELQGVGAGMALTMSLNNPSKSRTVARRHPARTSTPWLLLSSLFVYSMACTSGAGIRETVRILPDELLSGTALGVVVDVADVTEEQEVLAMSAAMKEFLDNHVDREERPAVKLRQLVHAIIDSGTFRIEYEGATRSASETFRVKRGNCLSFSIMFVAMARDLSLDGGFQEVEIPPDWTLDEDTFVLNRHVNIYVDLGLKGKRVVDFNIGDFKTSYEMQTISDDRALAHFYNNIGVERMQAGDTAAALANFRRAIGSGEQYSPGWTHLGILYRRHGNSDHAEAAYLKALEGNPGDSVAMSNLASLYELSGDLERAATYRKRVIDHRNLNPYYRYELARRAFAEHRYEEAIGHLKFGVRKRPQEDKFCFLLGLAYYQKGNLTAARRWFARAEEVAATASLKDRYSSKIETLLFNGDS